MTFKKEIIIELDGLNRDDCSFFCNYKYRNKCVIFNSRLRKSDCDGNNNKRCETCLLIFGK